MTGIVLVLDPTRVSGMLAFGAAGAACLAVAAARRAPRASIWRTLAVVQLLCFLEVVFAFRYRWHGLLNGVLQQRGWYDSRDQWQAPLLIAALALATGIAAAAAWRHRGDRVAGAAIGGTALGVSVLGAETISLHRVDALMYAQVGPLVGLAWMWTAASLVVTGAALARLR